MNQSGIKPTEYKVLIEPMPIDEKIGNIILPDANRDKEKYAQIKGKIVDVAPLAFSYASDEEWAAVGGHKPKPGDKIIYAKYAGVTVQGPKDGVEYTLANDKDICATIEE